MPFSAALAVFVAAAGAVAAAADPLNFLVMGDWGGQPTWPYYTAAERQVAAAMDSHADTAHFALALGDNFYDEGVTSVDDPRWKATFEGVFSGSRLSADDFKFHVLAGNHDHNGNVSAEIAYSAVDPRWSFPYYWYNFTETCPDGATVEFVFIDTVLLVGMPETEEGEVLAGDALPGPPCAGAAKAQWDYIEKTLAASTADYLIVAGHYPVWSIAEHGPTSQLVEQLRPLLIKAKASAYFCGHDHAAEHIDDGTGVQYHVIGASHGVDDSTAHMDSVPSGSLKFHFPSSSAESFNGGVGAFATVSASKTGLVVTHYRGDDGSVLYTAPTIAPRTGLRE